MPTPPTLLFTPIAPMLLSILQSVVVVVVVVDDDDEGGGGGMLVVLKANTWLRLDAPGYMLGSATDDDDDDDDDDVDDDAEEEEEEDADVADDAKFLYLTSSNPCAEMASFQHCNSVELLSGLGGMRKRKGVGMRERGSGRVRIS